MAGLQEQIWNREFVRTYMYIYICNSPIYSRLFGNINWLVLVSCHSATYYVWKILSFKKEINLRFYLFNGFGYSRIDQRLKQIQIDKRKKYIYLHSKLICKCQK